MFVVIYVCVHGFWKTSLMCMIYKLLMRACIYLQSDWHVYMTWRTKKAYYPRSWSYIEGNLRPSGAVQHISAPGVNHANHITPNSGNATINFLEVMKHGLQPQQLMQVIAFLQTNAARGVTEVAEPKIKWCRILLDMHHKSITGQPQVSMMGTSDKISLKYLQRPILQRMVTVCSRAHAHVLVCRPWQMSPVWEFPRNLLES